MRIIATAMSVAGIVSAASTACGTGEPTGRATTDEVALVDALGGYFAAFKARDTAQLRRFTTSDFVLYENGYPIERARWIEAWDSLAGVSTQHRFSDLRISVFGDVASLSYVLEWLNETGSTTWGRETAVARKAGGRWLFSHFHSSWFPPLRPMSVRELETYSGLYRSDREDVSFLLRVRRDGEQLYLEREDGKPVAASLRRLKMFPEDRDRFYLEVTTDRVVMQRDLNGDVATMVLHPSMTWNETYRWVRIPSNAHQASF